MAEGGGEEDLDNPFSFKTYVKKKTKQHDEQDIDTDDIFAVAGAAVSRKKEKQSLVVTDDHDGKFDYYTCSSSNNIQDQCLIITNIYGVREKGGVA